MSNTTLHIYRFIRQGFVAALDGLTVEQINQVPPGFNNNIIWNLAHVVAVQQAICYQRAGLEPLVDLELIEDYHKGTFPKDRLEADKIEKIKQLALSTIDDLDRDLATGKFANFEKWNIRELELTTIEDALQFMLFHEGMHVNTANLIKRAVAA